MLKKLNSPQNKLPHTIQIAGTNGKGSVATSIYQLQKQSGKKVHVYRSPHLISFNERIIVANKIISDQKLYKLLLYVYQVNNNATITFFEFFTAAAFYVFSKIKADLFVCEVGLGGRYDATNVLNEKKKTCIITSIGLDHKEFLGNNIKHIANEKSGIMKNNNILICSKQNKRSLSVIKRIANKKNCISYFYGEDWFIKNKYLYFERQKIDLKKLSLVGDHQYQNVGCAIMACNKINILKIKNKLIPSLIQNITMEGRLHKLNGSIKKKYPNIELWVDCAHNVLGFQALSKWVLKNKFSELFIILSVGIQKDYKGILNQIKKMNPKLLFFINKTNFSSRTIDDLVVEAKSLKIKHKIFNTVFDSIEFISLTNNSINYNKCCLITGSINFVGEVLSKDKKN